MEIAQGKKAEATPLDTPDAKVLLDAIKEMNISRRNVGLYPRNHPQTKESAVRALQCLQQLFEVRGDVTLGIAKDEIVVDDASLDKKSAVFKEFALSLYTRGITAITLEAGLTSEDLFTFNELTTERDALIGTALIEYAEKRGLEHIRLSPLDLSKIKFVQGILRKESADNTFWNDYIASLLDGSLTGEDMDNIISTVTPEEMAQFINKNMQQEGAEKAYEAVISSYMGKQIKAERRATLFGKFLAMVDFLTLDMKQQFLSRALKFPFMDMNEVSKMLRELAFDDMQKVMKIFDEQASLLPDRLKSLISKLMSSTTDIFAQIQGGGIFYMDDIEVDESIVSLFRKDPDSKVLDDDYRTKLKKITEGPETRNDKMTGELESACAGEIVDKTVSKIVFELLSLESNSPEEYRKLLSNLAGLVEGFVETGRFSEIAEIHTRISAYALSGTFKAESAEMIKGFFGSAIFLARLMAAFRTWGKHNKEGVIDLAILLKGNLIPPFLDELSQEEDIATRKYLLDLLCRIGEDVVPEAVKRLDDKRWYVVRNMLYLVRECEGRAFIKRIRQLMKHPEQKVVIEALKTLLHFRTPDSISYIRFYLHGKDPEFREQAARLAGIYKVKEAAPSMVEILTEKDMFGTKANFKICLIHALGEVGDPGVLGVLQKIYTAHALLHKADLEKLKIEIFKSLHGYPFAEIRPLLQLGMQSKVREIKAISEKLLRTGGGKVD